MDEAPNRPEQSIWQNELLTVPEVAAYMRVSRVTVWRWCQQGVIPASQVGRNWRIRRKDLLGLFDTSSTEDGEHSSSTAADGAGQQTLQNPSTRKTINCPGEDRDDGSDTERPI